ncbi:MULTISPECIES: cytochrome c [unclassified Novosphingobium]|uniref:c-type cytochrome n=1 Tax=unclassified Novosphingobium TaxID=2644732 RepID=UPI0013576258|nr:MULTISPECIES: cytochrome c [unclassified Novosphingobium]
MKLRHWHLGIISALGLGTMLAACGSPARHDSAKANALEPKLAMSPGEALYTRKCGFCHIAKNTGTMMLERRLGAGNGELAKRTDLEADYVVSVARAGLMSMPAISRVDATDDELRQIADYLARNTKPQAVAR